MKLNLGKHSNRTLMLFLPFLIGFFLVSFSYAEESPSFSIGAFGGFASSMTGEAVKGYEKTDAILKIRVRFEVRTNSRCSPAV